MINKLNYHSMKTFDTFNRLYKVTNTIDKADEYHIILKLPVETQREIFIFVKSLSLSEVETNDWVTYIVMDPYEFEKFMKFSEITGIEYIIEDITDDVILGKDVVECQYVYNTLVSMFLENTLTVDMVLDKINIVGIDNITEIDKKFLVNS